MSQYLLKTVENKDDDPIIYDLFAVSNHFGCASYGHYTAYGYNRCASQWLYYDDTSV